MTNDKISTYRHDYERHFAQAACVATRGRGGTERDSKSQTKERPRLTLLLDCIELQAIAGASNTALIETAAVAAAM
jgi:hypothetical protein